MFNLKTRPKLFVILAIGGTLAGLALYGCQPTPASPTTQAATPDAAPSFALFGPVPKKSGVQLWAENCNRCHNTPPPERYSDAQWAIIVHHMALRANLTGDEQRKITEFLQASN